tara:strand:+ start:2147 stop:3025 length:879 start_codon:yes stop_codon:yes gene_type:complete
MNSLGSKQKLSILLFSIFCIFILDCTGHQSGRISNEESLTSTIKKGKLYWDQRTDTTSIKNAQFFIGSAYSQKPSDYDLAILYSEILYTNGLFFEKNKIDKAKLFLNGFKICKKAVYNHPDFSSIYQNAQGDSSFRLLSTISEAPKSLIPGLFWWANNLSRYLNSKPVLERIKNRELIEVILHRIISLDPSFNYSGAYRIFGSFYTRIPGIELSQSKNYFDQAINLNPNYFGNFIHLAEFYYQKAGNKELFNKILTDIINLDPSTYPEIMPENILYQEKAKTLLDKESSLFE